MNSALTEKGFSLMKKYIEEKCGIQIGEEKAYLIESRLSGLLVESGCSDYEEFYDSFRNRRDKEMAEKVIDAITTNETLWFRDKKPWEVLDEVLLPAYIREIREGKRTKVRIWSAACSTGQEPYSIAMCIDRHLVRNGIRDVEPSHFEILGTDISKTVLELARMAKYDSISIMRGLDTPYRDFYFINQGRVWNLVENIKSRVQFQRFNLQNDFSPLGEFDIIFCRYVMIYFSNELKNDVMRKAASILVPGGILFLGNPEVFMDYHESFSLERYKGGVYYKAKGQ